LLQIGINVLFKIFDPSRRFPDRISATDNRPKSYLEPFIMR
jgi:hypothetical protein